MTGAPAVWAFYSGCMIGVEEIITTFGWIIIPWDQVLNDGHTQEFGAPATPITDSLQGPMAFWWEILATATPEWVGSIWGRIDANIEEVVMECLEELLRSLKETLYEKWVNRVKRYRMDHRCISSWRSVPWSHAAEQVSWCNLTCMDPFADCLNWAKMCLFIR